MWPFKKKEMFIKTPIEAYKFTTGGLYLIEANRKGVTLKQAHDIQRKARDLNINIKVVLTEGDTTCLCPVGADSVVKK